MFYIFHNGFLLEKLLANTGYKPFRASLLIPILFNEFTWSDRGLGANSKKEKNGAGALRFTG
jgi:hypothetical protein